MKVGETIDLVLGAKSRAVLDQMKIDEAKHATTALDHGGAELPTPVKLAMKLASKVMTHTTYRL